MLWLREVPPWRWLVNTVDPIELCGKQLGGWSVDRYIGCGKAGYVYQATGRQGESRAIKVYKDWLFLEVAPELEWPSEEDFDTVPGVRFGVEALFRHDGQDDL